MRENAYPYAGTMQKVENLLLAAAVEHGGASPHEEADEAQCQQADASGRVKEENATNVGGVYRSSSMDGFVGFQVPPPTHEFHVCRKKHNDLVKKLTLQKATSESSRLEAMLKAVQGLAELLILAMRDGEAPGLKHFMSGKRKLQLEGKWRQDPQFSSTGLRSRTGSRNVSARSTADQHLSSSDSAEPPYGSRATFEADLPSLPELAAAAKSCADLAKRELEKEASRRILEEEEEAHLSNLVLRSLMVHRAKSSYIDASDISNGAPGEGDGTDPH